MFSYSYFMNEDLVYYFNFIDTQQQLCVFKTLEKEIFTIMHDNYYYTNFHQIYNSIVADLYI